VPAGRVIVVGGGISGLSAAYDLTRAGIDCTLIEKQPRLGGVIETRAADGCTLECGPDSFLSAKPAALALIRELGLEADLIGSNDRQRTTYIWKHGRLVALPEGVMMIVPSRVWPMVKSPLLSWPTKFRMGLEYFRKPDPRLAGRDRSVAEFVADHFGREALDYMAEPLLSGVYGGDPAQLSVRSVLPRFVEMEARYGSLVRGVLESRKHARAGGAAAPAPLFQTLKRGLSTLVDALASGVQVCRAEAETIERTTVENTGSGFRIRAGGSWIDAAHLVIACPAWAASRLVAGVDQPLAQALGGIDYSSSVTLSLIYRASDFDGMRAGFGFLVPKKERARLAACTFVGAKFPYRVPEDRIALRCFFGGTGDAAVLSESDESLVAIAREELRRILGLTAEPVSYLAARWPRSMAQYTVGHAQRLEQIRKRVDAIPGLYLAGNAYEGIGIPDCINTGRAAAKKIIGALGAAG
jgi:oxygen-dependent protoporphyrinogen oxidase